MKPADLRTKIFLDSGDPEDTRRALDLLGFLDGQTTNPSLIAKNPKTQGRKFTVEEIHAFYRDVIREISALVPQGSVSVEVYADRQTTAEQMLEQGREMFAWVPNAHVKLPITAAGLEAARVAVAEKMRVNMTLCFSEEQAAAVYAATRGASAGDVFLSPFVGRLDDIGLNGMDLIANSLKTYAAGDGHVQVLSASVRNLPHFLASLQVGCDIITAPLKVLAEWKEKGMPVPGADWVYEKGSLAPIAHKKFDLAADVSAFDIRHELTDKGIDRFAADWNALIK